MATLQEKPTLMQQAFYGKGLDMTSGSIVIPKFHTSLAEVGEVAQELSQRIPLMRGTIRRGKIIYADKVTVGKGKVEDFIMAPTCGKIIENDDGYNLVFSHDLIDGWSWKFVMTEIMRLAEGGSLRDEYKCGYPAPKVRPTGPDTLRVKPFVGIRGRSVDFSFDIDFDIVKTHAKKYGIRVQELLATAFGRALGNPNILTTKIIPGFEDHFGHYSLYGCGSLDENGFYKIDCSHENYSRLMMRFGTGSSNGNAFVSSFPVGEANYTGVGHVQFLDMSQLGRAQLGTYPDRAVLRIQLNQAIENPEFIAERTCQYLLSELGEY